MDKKIAKELTELFSQVVGQKFIHAILKEREVNKQKVLLVEMTFSDKGVHHTIVLALDKDLVKNDYIEIAKKY